MSSRKRRQQLTIARESKIGYISNELPCAVSASERKLSMGNLGGDIQKDEAQTGATQQWLLVHVGRLNYLIQDLLCPNCAGSGLEIHIDPQNYGFCSNLSLECCLCKGDPYRTSVYTSTRLQEETRSDVAFDVNVRMVLLAHELGMGYAALKKISKVLGIPALHLRTYQRHDKRVTGMDTGLCQKSLSSL